MESAETGADFAEAEINTETSCVPSFPVKPPTEPEVAGKLPLALCWSHFVVNLWFTFMSNSKLHHVLSHCHLLNLPEYLIMTNICLSCVRLDQPNRRATQTSKPVYFKQTAQDRKTHSATPAQEVLPAPQQLLWGLAAVLR